MNGKSPLDPDLRAMQEGIYASAVPPSQRYRRLDRAAKKSFQEAKSLLVKEHVHPIALFSPRHDKDNLVLSLWFPFGSHSVSLLPRR